MSDPVGRGRGLSLLELAALLRRRWRVAVGIPAVVALSALVFSLFQQRQYTSEIAFLTDSEGPQVALPGLLGGLAGQLGVSLGGAERSPDFYRALLGTRPVVDSLLAATFATDQGPATLVEILDVRGRTPAGRHRRARGDLRDRIDFVIDRETGINRIRVTMPSRALAAEVARRLFGELQRFNGETRVTGSRARAEFLAEQVGEARAALAASEDSLVQFLSANRFIESDPLLVAEHGRHQRSVLLRQEIYQSLAQQYETTRIEAVDDVPQLTVVEEAIPPARASSPRPLLFAIAGALIGVLVAAVLLVTPLAWARWQQADPDGAEALRVARG